MNCDEIAIQLDEYLDGELADADRRQVEAHLAGCALCTESFESLEREMAMFGQYARPVESGDAMWAAVRTRIEPGLDSANVVRGAFGSRRFLAPLIAAACLAIVAGVGFVAWRASQTTPTIAVQQPPTPVYPAPTSQPPVVIPPVANDAETAPPSIDVANIDVRPRARRSQPQPSTAPAALPLPIANVERQYIAAIALLNSEIDRTAGSNPAARELSRKPMNDLGENIRTARRAVELNPNDPVAVNSMMSAYDEKLETMQRLVALQARNDR